MTKLTIGGVTHDIPIYRLREIKAAAPYIDRVLAERRALSTQSEGETAEQTATRMVEHDENALSRMTSGLSDTVAVLAVGVLKGRAEFPYTPDKIARVTDELEGEFSMEELGLLGRVFDEILREAGMVKSGPTPAARRETPASHSPSELTESSQSLSLPGAPAETGSE